MEPNEQAFPLHQSSGDPDEAWSEKLEIGCDCGHSHPLGSKKCPQCKRANPLRRLRKKRHKIEKWLGRMAESEVTPAIEKAGLLQELAKTFDNTLAEVIRNPFPGRRKNEDINKYMKRVASFFPTMFKSTSPKQMAIRLSETVPRASASAARTAWTESLRVLNQATGLTFQQPVGRLIELQTRQVNSDLLELATPYLEALRTLQLSHSRMVTAYGPTRDIFRRELDGSRKKTLWNKARSMVSSSGQHLRFPTAVWKDSDELEKLKRLDTNLGKFLEQSELFRRQLDKLRERTIVLHKTYQLSLRRHMARCLVDRAVQANSEERKLLVRSMLSQKGVSSWLWRWLFGKPVKQERKGRS